MLKKFPSDKISGTKHALFFLSRAPYHHGFAFDWQFLHELKCKVPLYKTVIGIFHFRFLFVFIKVIFLFNKMHGLCDFKTWKRIPFKIKIIEKPHIILLPDLWFLSCNKKFQNSMIFAWVGAPQNWPGDKFFELSLLQPVTLLKKRLWHSCVFLWILRNS